MPLKFDSTVPNFHPLARQTQMQSRHEEIGCFVVIQSANVVPAHEEMHTRGPKAERTRLRTHVVRFRKLYTLALDRGSSETENFTEYATTWAYEYFCSSKVKWGCCCLNGATLCASITIHVINDCDTNAPV